jgi:hypothetical protein
MMFDDGRSMRVLHVLHSDLANFFVSDKKIGEVENSYLYVVHTIRRK